MLLTFLGQCKQRVLEGLHSNWLLLLWGLLADGSSGVAVPAFDLLPCVCMWICLPLHKVSMHPKYFEHWLVKMVSPASRAFLALSFLRTPWCLYVGVGADVTFPLPCNRSTKHTISTQSQMVSPSLHGHSIRSDLI